MPPASTRFLCEHIMNTNAHHVSIADNRTSGSMPFARIDIICVLYKYQQYLHYTLRTCIDIPLVYVYHHCTIISAQIIAQQMHPQALLVRLLSSCAATPAVQCRKRPSYIYHHVCFPEKLRAGRRG